MKRWRIGIIGCGWAGERHAESLMQLKDRAEIAAVADIDAEVANAKAREWNVPLSTTDYHEFLTKEEVDAVSICLPHDLHEQSTIEAAEAGLHILIEKPLANNLAQADAMIAAAEEAGVHLMVAEPVRFESTYLRAAEMLKDGFLGKIFLIRIFREHHMHEYLRQRPWFLEQESAGIMVSGGIHDYEVLRMLGGEIEHVYGLECPKVLPEMVADDSSVALAGFQSGTKAIVVESFSIKTPRAHVQITVNGSLGSMWISGNSIQFYKAEVDGLEDEVEEILVPKNDPFFEEIQHFLDCLDSGKESITSGREERKPLAAVQATYESFQTGKRVYLEDLNTETS